MTRTILTQWAAIQRKLSGLANHALEPHAGGWSPNTDVYESADEFVVKVELAGVEKNEVHIHVEEQVLVIQGMRRDPYGGESAQGYRFRQMEIEYGPFQRIIPIPCPVDARTARAQVTAGILKIYLPKAPAAAQVKIAVAMES